MECPECTHVDDVYAFEAENEDGEAYCCPECEYVWVE